MALLLWRAREKSPALRLEPLTTTSGFESTPTLSPDGEQVAFSWEGERFPEGENPNYDIWVKMVGASETRRLTTDPGDDAFPAWSPDGRLIAFRRVRSARAGLTLPITTAEPSLAATLHLVSPLGGPDRKLSDFPAAWSSQLSWSPDGHGLAVARASSLEPRPEAGIFLISTKNGEARVLTSPQAPAFDLHPAFSPDGKQLAYASCLRTIYWTNCHLEVVDLGEGQVARSPPRRLTRQSQPIYGLAFSRDGTSIIFGGGPLVYLWRVGIGGDSPPERIDLAGFGAQHPSIAAARDRLVFIRDFTDVEIHEFEEGRPPRPLLASSFWDFNPNLSPDGRRISFSSGRSGDTQECWLADADGSNPVQLTRATPGIRRSSGRWSPDGRRLVFNPLGEDGHWDLWTIDADGASLRPLTSDAGDEQDAYWSHDGRTVYFASNRSGRREIWSIPAEGGEQRQLTTEGGLLPAVAADGKTLLYKKDLVNGPLFGKSLTGGRSVGCSTV